MLHGNTAVDYTETCDTTLIVVLLSMLCASTDGSTLS